MPVIWWSRGVCTVRSEEAIRHALHMKYVREELTIKMPDRPIVLCDASAAIGFANCVIIPRLQKWDHQSQMWRHCELGWSDDKGTAFKYVQGWRDQADAYVCRWLSASPTKLKDRSWTYRLNFASLRKQSTGDVEGRAHSSRETQRYWIWLKPLHFLSKNMEGSFVYKTTTFLNLRRRILQVDNRLYRGRQWWDPHREEE